MKAKDEVSDFGLVTNTKGLDLDSKRSTNCIITKHILMLFVKFIVVNCIFSNVYSIFSHKNVMIKIS